MLNLTRRQFITGKVFYRFGTFSAEFAFLSTLVANRSVGFYYIFVLVDVAPGHSGQGLVLPVLDLPLDNIMAFLAE